MTGRFLCCFDATSSSSSPDHGFFVPDHLCLFLISRFYSLYHVKTATFTLFHPDLSLDQAMLRTVGQTIILFGIDGKPAYLFAGLAVTVNASGTGHFPIMHGFFL